MLEPDQLRAIALSLPEAEERATWGEATFRVHHKIFVILAEGDRRASIKASPAEQEALVRTDPDTFAVAPYTGRYGWVAVRLDSADPGQVRELLIDAWRRTAPKRLVAAYADQR